MYRKQISEFSKIIDVIILPIRAIFLPEKGVFGLSSLKEERMRTVAFFCRGKVLDVGCGPGNLFIKSFIGKKEGVGIDIFPYAGVENVVDDMAHLSFKDCSFDTITLIAVGGHIPRSKRRAEFKEFTRVLKPRGLLIITEGEPFTQFLNHKWFYFYYRLFGKKEMDSERGMKEGEEYCIPTNELMSYLNTSPLRFIKRKRFQWGLNNIYIAEKLNKK